MWHRPLSEMLSDVYDAVRVSGAQRNSARAMSVELDLPVEVSLEQRGGETMFIADLPIWRWRTAFDQIPGRLQIAWEEVEP